MRSSTSSARSVVALSVGAAALAWAALRRPTYGLRGRVVLVTGGSRGLGLVLARELAKKGARLALFARDARELERARIELVGRGASVLSIPGDVRNEADVARAVRETEATFGAVDVLVNNAGVIQVGPFAHMTDADFEESLDVHFWGPLRAIRAVLPAMRRRGSGRIVNVASVGGKVAVPHLLPYCAGKFALVALSDGLRAELAQDGILVTTVAPGLMRTGSHLKASFKGDHRREFRWFAAGASAPALAVSAEHAARAIVRAIERGQPSLTIGVAARVAIAAEALAPGLAGRTAAMVDRLLPGDAGAAGNDRRLGEDLGTSRTLEWVTTLGRAAAAQNNET
ncbi:MAG: SDR family NAD(P)-dependent oxidoreductase [Vicinamibacteria bacterium]